MVTSRIDPFPPQFFAVESPPSLSEKIGIGFKRFVKLFDPLSESLELCFKSVQTISVLIEPVFQSASLFAERLSIVTPFVSLIAIPPSLYRICKSVHKLAVGTIKQQKQAVMNLSYETGALADILLGSLVSFLHFGENVLAVIQKISIAVSALSIFSLGIHAYELILAHEFRALFEDESLSEGKRYSPENYERLIRRLLDYAQDDPKVVKKCLGIKHAELQQFLHGSAIHMIRDAYESGDMKKKTWAEAKTKAIVDGLKARVQVKINSERLLTAINAVNLIAAGAAIIPGGLLAAHVISGVSLIAWSVDAVYRMWNQRKIIDLSARVQTGTL